MPGATHTRYGFAAELSAMLSRAFCMAVKSPPDLATTTTLWYGEPGAACEVAHARKSLDLAGDVPPEKANGMQTNRASRIARAADLELGFITGPPVRLLPIKQHEGRKRVYRR